MSASLARRPVGRHQGLDRGEPGRLVEVDDRRARARSFLIRPAQHRARAHLDTGGHALGLQAPHRRLPAHRRGHLAHQRRRSPPRRRASARRRRWRRPARADRARVSARSSGASRSSAGCISAQWKGALTCSGITRLAPRALARSPARATAAACPAITTWPGRVEVGRADHLAVGRLVAGRAHRRRVEAEHRGHRARARPARPPACSGRGDAPCATASAKASVPAATWARVLAQAVSGDECRPHAARFEQPPGRDAHGEDRRLGVLGERQAIDRAIEA